jgi:hypothetical protein
MAGASPSRPAEPAGSPPESFLRLVESLRAVDADPAVELREIAPPTGLAPYSFALSADVAHGDDVIANGRFIVLHDPTAGDGAWPSNTRIVVFASAEIDESMAADPLLAEVGWAWLLDALGGAQAHYAAAAGTVTRTSSTKFGDISGSDSDVEFRGSWSALDDESLAAHLRAYCEFLCLMAGLPPAVPGTARLPLTRRG